MSVGGGERIMLVHNPVLEKPVLHPHPSVPVAASQLHVAIICDGNGRWATSRALSRSAGHRAGAEAARRVIRCAPHLGIHTLTLFALSSANWARPAAEVAAILQILQEYLAAETSHCLDEGIRLAIDYSARHTIFQAASKFYKVTDLSSEAFGNILAEVQRGGSTDVDLLIRTGGEQRLSDFLLWECAFAEFCFLPKRWPDFTPKDLRDMVKKFEQRERTRGDLPHEAAF